MYEDKLPDRFWEISQSIDKAYENYAKSVGLSYTGLSILQLLSYEKECTQKDLCEQLFLPKQTINTIIMTFHKQSLVDLIELADDRRQKAIHLTEKGMAYANTILPRLDAAEDYAMKQLDETERAQLVNSMEKYAKAFALRLK